MVDETHLGTPETAWERWGRLDALPPLDVGKPRKVIVIAPHPDDEVLGVGGLIQFLIASGTPVEVLAVTDGEGSHPGATEDPARRLGDVRPQETLLALRRLGWPAPRVTRLGVPDGQVAENVHRVVDALTHRARADDLWLSPWKLDGHPDHDACGQAACSTATALGVRSLSYLIWAWHWADPRGVDLPWRDCRRFDLDRPSHERKRWSIEAFGSQIHPLGSRPGEGRVLPPSVLKRFRRGFETYIEAGPDA